MKSLLRFFRMVIAICAGVFGAMWIMWLLYGPPTFDEIKDEFLTAVESGNVDQVTRKLDSGANPNKRFLYGTPLTRAAYAGQTAVVDLLIQRGAKVDLADDATYTPLMGAIHSRHVETAKALLAHGADLTKVDRFGGTALSLAAAKGPPELVELLLDQGADVHHKDNRGWQPLHAALRSSRLPNDTRPKDERRAIVEILLVHGADPNSLNPGGWQEDTRHDSHIGIRFSNPNHGNTPLSIAISNGFDDIVRLLKKYGAARLDDELDEE